MVPEIKFESVLRQAIYEDGWYFAECEWNDLEPYDTNFFATHLDSDAEAEVYQEGYYDFWKTKGFSLD